MQWQRRKLSTPTFGDNHIETVSETAQELLDSEEEEDIQTSNKVRICYCSKGVVGHCVVKLVTRGCTLM